MNRIKYQIISFVFLIAASSCDQELLDLYPKTQITEGNFFQTKDQLVQIVNDTYRQVQRVYSARGLPSLFGELRSDNTQIITVDGFDFWANDITDFRMFTDNEGNRNAWEICYNAIHICNTAITQLENAQDLFQGDDQLRQRLIAEARFNRSLIYFNMVRAWDGVPFALQVVDPEDAYGYLRESPATIYSQLETDLLSSKDALLESYQGTDVGRVTKYGAAAVLAKLYLTIGEPQSAENELKEIIDSGMYSLDANDDGSIDIDDYLHLFSPDTKNSRSSILELQYLGGEIGVNSDHQQNFSPHRSNVNLPGTSNTYKGYGFNIPSDDLINEFETGDERKDISIAMGYTDLVTGDFIDYPFTMKFYDPNFDYPGQNFEVIRYADILLMYAEVTNDPQYLNMVRSRAGLPLYGTTGYPSTQYQNLEQAIEHERRVELCFEFHRFFDLKRTGRATEVMGAKGYSINNNKLVFPIPLRVVDTNPKITQNQGY